MNAFTAPHFQDAEEARKLIESIRWPHGPICGHCGERERRYATKRVGRWRCGNPECRKDYTATTGTVMESSHIPLNKWMMGYYLMSASKKGMSAHQLHRALGVTYKSAWFMAHRIREAMRTGGLAPLGGEGKVVEGDEMYHGKISGPARYSRPSARKNFKPTKSGKSGPAGKRAIVGLVERGGEVRMFHVAVADKASVNKIISENIAKETRFLSDESTLYRDVPGMVKEHETVKHSIREYARYDDGFTIHTNTIEGVFGIFKRGMNGVYQHCDEKHLHRYLAEFDFRYNHRSGLGFNDQDRTTAAVRGAEGKRLTYR